MHQSTLSVVEGTKDACHVDFELNSCSFSHETRKFRNCPAIPFVLSTRVVFDIHVIGNRLQTSLAQPTDLPDTSKRVTAELEPFF